MEDKKKKDWLFWLFLLVSAIWAIVVFRLLFDDQYYYNGSSAMELNEVGDFLAGSFSPLAFFWLAYGYFMQNKELKSNTSESQKAYDLASDQLKFQKIIYEKELDDRKRKLMPIFVQSVCETIDSHSLKVTMKNIGANVKEVSTCNINKFSFSDFRTSSILEKWSNSETESITVTTETDLSSLNTRAISITSGNCEHVNIAKKITIRFIDNENSQWEVTASIRGLLHNNMLTIDIDFDQKNGYLNAHRMGEEM